MRKLNRTFDFRMRAVVALLSLGLVSPALAHARLVFAAPAENATVTPAPTELRLKFSEGVELKFTKARLTGPQMKVIEIGAARLDPDDNSLLIVPIAAPLPDGKYTVDWQAVSSDGHKTNGAYVFDSMK